MGTSRPCFGAALMHATARDRGLGLRSWHDSQRRTAHLHLRRSVNAFTESVLPELCNALNWAQCRSQILRVPAHSCKALQPANRQCALAALADSSTRSQAACGLQKKHGAFQSAFRSGRSRTGTQLGAAHDQFPGPEAAPFYQRWDCRIAWAPQRMYSRSSLQQTALMIMLPNDPPECSKGYRVTRYLRGVRHSVAISIRIGTGQWASSAQATGSSVAAPQLYTVGARAQRCIHAHGHGGICVV